MARQAVGAAIPPLQDSPRNAEGHADGNPSRAPEQPVPMAEGYPVSPAVARVRAGAPAAHGQGGGGK